MRLSKRWIVEHTIAWEYAFPVSLSLPLREDRYIGPLVIAMFDNLQPGSDAMHRNAMYNKCYTTCAQFADAALSSLCEKVPRNQADLCDSITD